MQGNGWSPSPAASPIATTGWNSPNSTSTAAVPTRPTKGSGGIGGWNPQGWNGVAAPANTQSKVATSSPRGPPPNDVGWGGRVTKGSVNLGGNEGDGETALGKAGVIGAGFRRAKSTMELNGRSAASPAGSSRTPDNNIVISEVGTPGTSMRLFAKSFADISVEARQQTSIVPVKDELATAIGIYVFGLPATFKIKEILSIFGEFGDVMNAGLTPASASNPRAYAHILYEEVGSAAKAIRATHGKNVTASSDPLEVVPDFGATVPASAVSVSSTPTPGVPASTMAKVPQQPHQSTNSASSNVDASLGVENRTVHIANVPLTVTKADVEKIFGRGAEIRFINIVPRPKEKRNMVFITFKNHAAASKALSIAKTGKHFGMTEALKVDFSKAETRAAVEQQKQNTGVASTSTVPPASSTMKDAAPVVTMKKKTEVAKPQEKKLSEKKSTTSLTASISSANGNSGKKTQRPSLYIRDVKSSETEASLSATLAQQAGPVSSCHIISRLDGGTRYALVTFEHGEDAAKAVRDKIENAVYPRQRRITLSHIPKDATESQLMKVFQSCGEVKRVEFLSGSSDTDGYLTAELEFARGDGAILAHIMLVEGKIGGNLSGVRGGYSLPTSNTVSGSTEAEETAATATVASDTVTMSDSVGNANDEISNQHDYSQYDIEGGDDVEVIRLSDLEE
ncbi:hypothetical protein HDU79_008194 [Rhizoclosmatium sp. JEL0117]|nr:hypothetical protein HDU79_008194 [Rhizoclosmatium sp. JEL0117]